MWAVLHASENLLVRRDPGPYGLVGSWVAQHGTIEMPSGATVFGHLPGIAFNSPAFYGRHGDLIQPQFMSGLPVTLAPAAWIGGLSWLLKANAVIGGFALLAFAGFVARAVGPRAAPFATLVLALAYPETHAFRSPYSEPLTQLMVFGGLCLLWDAGRTRPRAVALAGVVLGLTTAVRVDALADLLPLAAVVVVYALSGRARDARALPAGLLGGVAVGAADGFLLHYAYIHDTRAQLRLVGVATVAGRRSASWSRYGSAGGCSQRDWQQARTRLGAVAVVVAAADRGAGLRGPAVRRPPAQPGQRPHGRRGGPAAGAGPPDASTRTGRTPRSRCAGWAGGSARRRSCWLRRRPV